MLKNLLRVVCAIFIFMSSVAMFGCGAISEKDLPNKSKEFMIEFQKNAGFIKPKDMPCAQRFDTAFKNTEKLLNKLKPEIKEMILDETVDVTYVELYNPVNTTTGYTLIPMAIQCEAYLKKYPENKNRGVANAIVAWQKVNDKWVVYDIQVNGKSHLDRLEGLKYEFGNIVARAIRMREKAKHAR